MNILRKVETLGLRGRYGLPTAMQLGYVSVARELYHELTPENTDALMASINTKATKLLKELTAKVDTNITTKAELLRLVEQVDELHCAADGLRDLLIRFHCDHLINQEELLKLYHLHLALLVQLAKSGLTFNEIMEHLTRSRNLLSPPMGCYSSLPDSPWNSEEEEDFGVVIQGTIILIELGLDTAPSHLSRSRQGSSPCLFISQSLNWIFPRSAARWIKSKDNSNQY